MTELEMIRTNHLIDPAMHIWGWEIPVYLFLGGMTAGIMILTALMLGRRELSRSKVSRFLPLAAPLLLSLGMGALFLDLEHKLHVYRFYLAFRVTSPMSWGAWILLAIYPATVLLWLATVTQNDLAPLIGWVNAKSAKAAQALSALHSFAIGHIPMIKKLNIVLGIGLGFYTGVLLGTLGARAAWGSGILGPLFLVSGLSAGAAFLMLFGLHEEEQQFLRRWDMLAIGLELALLVLYFINLGTLGGAAGSQAVSLFFGGKFTAPFWSLVVILGLLVPLGLEALEGRDHATPGVAQVSGRSAAVSVAAMSAELRLVAPVLVLIGGFALRMILVKAGQV